MTIICDCGDNEENRRKIQSWTRKVFQERFDKKIGLIRYLRFCKSRKRFSDFDKYIT